MSFEKVLFKNTHLTEKHDVPASPDASFWFESQVWQGPFVKSVFEQQDQHTNDHS